MGVLFTNPVLSVLLQVVELLLLENFVGIAEVQLYRVKLLRLMNNFAKQVREMGLC